jgi:hypothetical protein
MFMVAPHLQGVVLSVLSGGFVIVGRSSCNEPRGMRMNLA